ncbi:hypothetical protein RC1_3615 [Rhodospirillum centenum SW]|uniref:Uncharacterized protein n=1 Tax=Rhodospirillum centenum (strain ATCC 51521 / SW) TaxID=414684 RepID=B6IXE0_RHOCS|nr:hypothetical protein RC1_3615 [Rhodospirillum centenum SW]
MLRDGRRIYARPPLRRNRQAACALAGARLRGNAPDLTNSGRDRPAASVWRQPLAIEAHR